MSTPLAEALAAFKRLKSDPLRPRPRVAEATATNTPAASPPLELGAHARTAGRKTITGSTLGDMVVFPPHDAGFAARHAIAGIDPHTDAIMDTRTVHGVGLAHLNLDPVAEAFCARLDGKHDD